MSQNATPLLTRSLPSKNGEACFRRAVKNHGTNMNLTLLILVILYLLGTLAIGAWAGTRIKDTSDFAVAGHRLPLIMVITTSFATWFGAETVMGSRPRL